MKRQLKSFMLDTSLVSTSADAILKKIENTVNRWFIDNPDVVIKQFTTSQINDTNMLLFLIYEEQE